MSHVELCWSSNLSCQFFVLIRGNTSATAEKVAKEHQIEVNGGISVVQ